MNKILLIGIGAMLALALGLGLASQHFSGKNKELAEIQREVRNRVITDTVAKCDFRVIPKGERAKGNCSVFAATAKYELEKAGYQAEYRYCWWKGETYHVNTLSEGYAFDNHYDVPMPAEEVEKECPSLPTKGNVRGNQCRTQN